MKEKERAQAERVRMVLLGPLGPPATLAARLVNADHSLFRSIDLPGGEYPPAIIHVQTKRLFLRMAGASVYQEAAYFNAYDLPKPSRKGQPRLTVSYPEKRR